MDATPPQPPKPNALSLEDTLRRSVELEEAAWSILEPETFELFNDATNVVASFHACELANQHAQAIRELISAGFDASPAVLLRVQFEAMVRAMWLLYAATDEELDKISSPLTVESEACARRLPMASKMIDALKKTGPAGLHDMLQGFRSTMFIGLNSFIHAGIHPIQLGSAGYPEHVIAQILRNSNAVFLMTTMLLANLTGDSAKSMRMSKIQPDFADCLPELLLDR